MNELNQLTQFIEHSPDIFLSFFLHCPLVTSLPFFFAVSIDL
jgi:hypothetical protein